MTSVRRGSPDALSDEQCVFVDCVEDILQATPGLRYAVFLDPADINSSDKTAYALFVIDTNPAFDLTVSIELTERSFTVRVGGISSACKRGKASRFEWWIERRCRDLARMLSGDLRVTQAMLLWIPVSSTLFTGRGKKWRKLGSNENGWFGLLSFFLPFGLLFTTEKSEVFGEWWVPGGTLPGPAD